MQVSLIPHEHVEAIWPRIEGFMAEAAAYSGGRYETTDILEALLKNTYTLWVAFEGDEIKGAVATSFVIYPRKTLLHLTFCGGDEGMAWKDPMLKMLQHWAYDNNCDGIEANGRLGWSGIFKEDGYKPLWQVFELPTGEAGLGA